MVTGGKEGGGLDQKVGIDTYTLVHIKQITNKDLLYSAGNSILCNSLQGTRIQKRVDIFIFITDSFCCTLETKTLQINYTPVEILKNILKI